MAGPRKFTVTMPDKNKFSFDWDTETQGDLNQEKVLDLYEKSKQPKQTFASKAWEAANKPAINLPRFDSMIGEDASPLVKNTNRVYNWFAGNVAEPMTSPLGVGMSAVGLPASLTRAGQIGLGAVGSGFGAYGLSQAIPKLYNEGATLENVLDVGASTLGAVAGPLAYKYGRDVVDTSKWNKKPTKLPGERTFTDSVESTVSRPKYGVLQEEVMAGPKLRSVNNITGLQQVNTNINSLTGKPRVTAKGLPPASPEVLSEYSRISNPARFIEGEHIGLGGFPERTNLDVTQSPSNLRLGAVGNQGVTYSPGGRMILPPVEVKGLPNVPSAVSGDKTTARIARKELAARKKSQTSNVSDPSINQSQKLPSVEMPEAPWFDAEGQGSLFGKPAFGQQVIAPDETPLATPNKAQGTLQFDKPKTTSVTRTVGNPVIQEAASSNVPEIKAAAQQAVKEGSKSSKSWTEIRQEATKEMGQVIEDDSEAGKSLMNLFYKGRTDGNSYAGQFTRKFQQIVKPLKENEWNLLRDAFNGRLDPNVLTPELQAKFQAWKALDNDLDMFVRSKGVDTSKDPITGVYADKRLEGKFPEDRTDRGSYEKHIEQMGLAAGYTEHMGHIGSKDSPAGRLIRQTNNPERVQEALDIQFGRVPVPKSALVEGANRLNRLTAMTDLSMYVLNQQAQKVPIILRNNFKSFWKAIQEYKTETGKGAAQESGALQAAMADIMRGETGEGGNFITNKLYRVKASEEANRSLAALAGKHYAQEKFAKLKGKGVNSLTKSEKVRLEDLLLEKIDDIAKMDSLDEKLVNRAMFRSSEKTQGLAEAIDLPKGFSSHDALTKLGAMYKKFAFRQAKSVKDWILEDPNPVEISKKVALGTALYGLTGEAVGDVRAGITAIATGENPLDAIAARGEDGVTGVKAIDRLALDLSQAWAFGLLGQALESSGIYGGLSSFIVGPVISKAASIGEGLYSAATGNPKELARRINRAVVPPPLRNTINKALGSEKKKSKPRLTPSGPKLPSVPMPSF